MIGELEVFAVLCAFPHFACGGRSFNVDTSYRRLRSIPAIYTGAPDVPSRLEIQRVGGLERSLQASQTYNLAHYL